VTTIKLYLNRDSFEKPYYYFTKKGIKERNDNKRDTECLCTNILSLIKRLSLTVEELR